MSEKPAQFALVTEGKTDQIVLSTLLSQVFSSCNDSDFKNVQPSDNTSNDINSEGGWWQVRKWCLKKPPALRRALFSGGLFATSPPYKALIIHLDGDLCDKAEFKNTHTLDEANFNLQQAAGRGQYLAAVLHSWLQTEAKEPIIFVLAIEAIETWLLAGLTDDLADIENNRDPEQTLLSVLKSADKAQAPQKKLRKNTQAL